MEEKIGKVILDTTCYPGKDLYSDGAIEDEMLAISRDFAPEEFNRVISERETGRFFIISLISERIF